MTTDINAISRTLGIDGEFAPSAIDSLMIDSRAVTCPATTLFVALRSPNNDGHTFIAGLIARGVGNFIVDHIPDGVDPSAANFLVVPDTLDALQRIGAVCRDAIVGPVVAVTGSRGKTIVKEWIWQAMHSVRPVVRSPRSWNSKIGVPLSLWQLSPTEATAIVEVGVSRSGEMALQAAMLLPDVGIITDITAEHDEGFASRSEKIAEKLSLFATASHIIYNRLDADVAAEVERRYAHRHLIAIEVPENAGVAGNKHYVEAYMRLAGCSQAEIDAGLSQCYDIVTRLDVVDGVNNCRIILDRFTADITSMLGALDLLNRRASGQRRTLIVAADIAAADRHAFDAAVAAYAIDRVIEVDAAHNLADRFTTDDFYNEIILIKGSPAVNLAPLYAMLEDKQHETLMEVNLDAIVSNFNFFRAKVKPTTGVICMLKAHGYGAGSIELARTLQSQGAAYIAVAVVDEGIELRRAGITMPIMVLNPRAQNRKMMFEYRLEPEIYSFDMLDDIIRSATRYGIKHFPVHIKIETGMRRLGFVEEEIDRLGRTLAATDSVVAATAFSHLACADDPSQDDYTRSQFDTFARCCNRLDALLPAPPRRHILNSTGILRFPEMQYDFVRLGIGLYGIPTLFDGSEDALRNVSRLTSPIISIKHWHKGDTIGYNRRGVLQRDSVIATVPVGYADGIDRHLGYGNLNVIVNGHRCRTVGSICMDICMIDVTDVDCAVGDRVEMFGDRVTPVEIADTLGTIPYEILTSVSPRVKRVYYRE